MHLVLPFRPAHLDLMEFGGDELMHLQPDWRDWLEGLAGAGPAYTLAIDGRPVLASGFVNVMPGVGNCWLLPSRWIDDHGLSAARAVRRVMDDLMETHQLHRLFTGSPDTDRCNRWMRHLGFELEGRMQKAGFNKMDLNMWARVR